jgi:hypothetical protein
MKNDWKFLYSNTRYLHVEYNQPKIIETKKNETVEQIDPIHILCTIGLSMIALYSIESSN